MFLNRASSRLKGFDYSSNNVYFLTICTHDRQNMFGDIIDQDMQLNGLGNIVAEEWLRSKEIRTEIDPDVSIVMPNHFHGIVWFIGGNSVVYSSSSRDHLSTGDRRSPLQPRSLGSFIAGFKASITKRIRENLDDPVFHVWQRGYYEHIIRDESDYDRIYQYILDNPLNWKNDRENPASTVFTQSMDRSTGDRMSTGDRRSPLRHPPIHIQK